MLLPLRVGVALSSVLLPLRVGVAALLLREGLAPVVGDVAVPLWVGDGRTPEELPDWCGVSTCGRSTPGVQEP